MGSEEPRVVYDLLVMPKDHRDNFPRRFGKKLEEAMAERIRELMGARHPTIVVIDNTVQHLPAQRLAREFGCTVQPGDEFFYFPNLTRLVQDACQPEQPLVLFVPSNIMRRMQALAQARDAVLIDLLHFKLRVDGHGGSLELIDHLD